MDDATADRLAQLERELTNLRLGMGSQVRTREVVVIDDAGVPRIRLSSTAGDGAGSTCRIVLLDADGFERVSVSALPGIGALRVVGRTEHEQRSHVDVFALDPEDGDGVYLGVELVDRGNSVGGHTVYEGREPRTWTRRP